MFKTISALSLIALLGACSTITEFVAPSTSPYPTASNYSQAHCVNRENAGRTFGLSTAHYEKTGDCPKTASK